MHGGQEASLCVTLREPPPQSELQLLYFHKSEGAGWTV